MTTIDFTGRGIPEIPPFSTTPVTVSRTADLPAVAPTQSLGRFIEGESAPTPDAARAGR